MDARFEVRFRHERRLLREVFRAGRRWQHTLLFVWAVLMGLTLAWNAAAGGESPATAWALFILFAVTSCVASPRFKARATEKRCRERFGGELPEATVRFSDEEIRLNLHKDEQHVEYAQVEKIVRRPGMWILTVVGRMMIPLPDAGYTQGRPEEFGEFIRGKCPQAKIRN